MCEANAELVRRLYDEFNETNELPRWALSPEVDWYPPADEPDNGLRRGADAVVAYVREWAATFENYHCAVQELIESGDCVIAPLVLHGRIGDSAAELSLPLTQVWTVRGGKVIRVREYRTKAEALTALATGS
jgi:ketosteroid isomerase-like protein